MKAPFPYFGNKSKAAPDVWAAIGDVRNYVEPFAGSLSVLLNRPAPNGGSETVNDLNCHLINAWRAIANDPASLAALLVAPVSEVETEATHAALIRGEAAMRDLLGDPDAYDLRRAAWWIKGANEWIGSGWCASEGPWTWTPESGWAKAGDGIKRKLPHLGNNGQGVNRQLPHLGNTGQGVNRQLPHLGDTGKGVNRQLSHLGNTGKGVNRQLPHLNTGQGVNRQLSHLGDTGKGHYQQRVDWITGWLLALRDRLASVRIACGDWRRVLGPSPTVKIGLTGVFLDPPYEGTEYVYGPDHVPVSSQVREWCRENGENPLLRVVLAGRGNEHDSLGWERIEWTGAVGYSRTDDNTNEVLWLSPHCISPVQDQSVFDF